MRYYSSDDLRWRGNSLHYGHGRKLTEIVQDDRYPSMWRVRRPDGSLTDMVNISRARDAARGLALRILNTQESTDGAGLAR